MSDLLGQKLAIFQKVLDGVPELTYAGNPILRRPANPATLEQGVELKKKLEPVLLGYRRVTGAGRGLAAPQIGVAKSVFITYVDDSIEVFINPKIVEKSPGTNFYREQCLSCGIFSCDVERPAWIIMEWTDEKGMPHREKIEGFKARLYQHEEAHLRGHLIVDDASPFGIEFALNDPLKEQLRARRAD